MVSIVQMCEYVFLVGRIDDGDWSTERSYVCMWNLERRCLNPKQADLVIDVPTAVTALSCHPNQPALIAGTLPVCGFTSWTDDNRQSLNQVNSNTNISPKRQAFKSIKTCCSAGDLRKRIFVNSLHYHYSVPTETSCNLLVIWARL